MSSEEELFLTEQYGSLGNPITYTRKLIVGAPPTNDIQRQEQIDSQGAPTALIHSVYSIFRDILLPHGYPESVSSDYFQYQLWDTVQAFCSTITGIFTTQATLKGVGVGDAGATVLGATITWILKDGTGMVGRIVFAWWKGSHLDCDCKKWRLFADILNDLAMISELCIPYLGYSVQILCVSTAMKSIVGVAGGATRASITTHQAIRGNVSEISAKDGSQETLVNLIASLVGILLLNYLTDPTGGWVLILTLIVVHLYSNYRAVKGLVFDHLNDQRLALILRDYLSVNAASSPERINAGESVLFCATSPSQRVRTLCGFRILLGVSLSKVLGGSSGISGDELRSLNSVYVNRKYFPVVDVKRRVIYVAFVKGEESHDVISGFYHAVLLGLATCMYNNISLHVFSKRLLHHSTPITRLNTFMKSFHHNNLQHPINIPPQILRDLNEFINQELDMFFTGLHINGWKTDYHSLLIDNWRIVPELGDKKYN